MQKQEEKGSSLGAWGGLVDAQGSLCVTHRSVSLEGGSDHLREKNRGRNVCPLAEIKVILSQGVSGEEWKDGLVSLHIAIHSLHVATHSRVH